MSDPKEAIKFYKTQLNRCRINLFVAKQRNDVKAGENIERKIQIYEYTVEVLKTQQGGNIHAGNRSRLSALPENR